MKALTGLQAFKYLPGGKKEKEANCKKCGFPTCMAFAMKLAKQEESIDKCEHASDEIKALLADASQKQQSEIKFGTADNIVITGNETVMFRHDKTFVNPTCIAVKLNCSDKDFDQKLSSIANYTVERVGENLKVDAVALYDDSKDENLFTAKAKQASGMNLALILVSASQENIKKALLENKQCKPLIYLKNGETSQVIELEKEFNVPVVISGSNIEFLAENTNSAIEKQVEDLVINLSSMKTQNIIENLTHIRRAAIEQKFKPLGFPTITFIDEIQGLSNDVIEKTIWASALMCKYSNIIVLDTFDEALIYSLLTLRQNIYTDPQKPLQIDSKLYQIGEVNEYSPVLVTTNFALTYFTVAGEIEASGIPCNLLITPSDGMSVLTAWAATKFTGEIIAKAIKASGIENMVNHRKIVIPGYVSSLKEEIEDEMPDWEILIGPNEAVDLVDYLRKLKIN